MRHRVAHRVTGTPKSGATRRGYLRPRLWNAMLFGGPPGTRTLNQLIKSQLLYH